LPGKLLAFGGQARRFPLRGLLLLNPGLLDPGLFGRARLRLLVGLLLRRIVRDGNRLRRHGVG